LKGLFGIIYDALSVFDILFAY